MGGNPDKITITNLKVFARHGVFPEEQEKGQDFYVNACLFLDCRTAGKSDALSDSVDYGAVCAFITEFLQNHTYKLIEAAAEYLTEALLLRYEKLRGVELELCKPYAPIGLPFENVSVKICRSWHSAWLSVGSNLGDKEKYIRDGLTRLSGYPQICVEKVSRLITTKPYGGVEQDDFLNGAVSVKTLFTPYELLEVLHETERQAERKREIHWGPRTLDLDIIFYDRLVLDEADLQIPHADMKNREFVLEPLLELCPNYRHPVLGRTVRELYEKLHERETAERVGE